MSDNHQKHNILLEKDLKYHFTELRNRILLIAGVFILFFFVSYVYKENIMNFILYPLIASNKIDSIISTDLSEFFISYIKITFITALLLSTPCIMWNIYFFSLPALYPEEKKIFLLIAICSLLLLIGSILFSYYIMIPGAIEFFISFQGNDIIPINIRFLAKLSNYIDILCSIAFGSAVVFQIPILMIFLCKMGVIQYETLRVNRKIVVVIVFIISAVLTPPDILSQIILALPMLLLYELSLNICRIMFKKEQNDRFKMDKKQS